MKRRIILVAIIAVLVGIILFLVLSGDKNDGIGNSDAYADAVKNGYSGTIEEWIAALVGETVPEESKTAFNLACQKGYSKSFDHWMQTLTGHTSPDRTISAYQLMKENGYNGTLTDWLNSLVKQPEKLGHSKDGGKTDYELACEYGFEGTYIEWMVSLVSKENQ